MILLFQSSENLNLVGFFDVHGSDTQDPLKCGDMNMNGVQNVLAFFYALSEVNRNLNHYFRPEVKLGKIQLQIS